jgi:hypothetical protein
MTKTVPTLVQDLAALKLDSFDVLSCLWFDEIF